MFAAIIRHGILVSVITLILLILGIAAIWRIPVQMIPDLETRVVGIETQWPGATPQDIEKDILIEQEEFLRNVPNLQRMESTASSGSAEIELEFPFGVDLTETLTTWRIMSARAWRALRAYRKSRFPVVQSGKCSY